MEAEKQAFTGKPGALNVEIKNSGYSPVERMNEWKRT
jgi:hypothetical protein